MSLGAQDNSKPEPGIVVAFDSNFLRAKLPLLRTKLPEFLSIALVAVASLRAEAPSIQGTLPEDYIPELRPLLQAAVERSPDTISASIAVAQQEAGMITAHSGLYPSINLTTQYLSTTSATGRSSSSTTAGLYYNAGVNQPIYQWGALENNARVGDLGVKIAQRQYAEAYRILATTIREQYLGLIARRVVLRNALFGQKQAQAALAAEQSKFDSGATSAGVLSSFKRAVDLSQLDVDRSSSDLAYAKRMFTRLVGIEVLSDESIPLMVPHPAYSAPTADAILAGFVGEGIESTFQSEVYNMTIKQKDLDYAIAKVRLLPRISASANFSYQPLVQASVGNVQQVGLQQETVGLTAAWTIFDGFATRGAKLTALENKRYFERVKKNYVDTTIDTITNLRHQIDFSSRSMAFAEADDDAAAGEVKRLKDDSGLGFVSQASIDAGVQGLYVTDYQMVNARSDFLNRWVEFISQAGIDPAISNLSPRYVR